MIQEIRSLASNSIPRAVRVITQDADGYVWVNTMDGLTGSISERFQYLRSYYGDLSGQLVYDESESALWMAGDHLKKFDLKSSRLVYYDSGPVNSIIHGQRRQYLDGNLIRGSYT